MSDTHDPNDEAHTSHPKPMQLEVNPDMDDRVEIPDHRKDALWDDAVTVEEYAEQVRALAEADPDQLTALHQAMRNRGLRG